MQSVAQPAGGPATGLRRLLDRWRAFANTVARVQTAIILTVVYWLMLVPIGVTMRLFRRNLLEHSRVEPDSYWFPREEVEYTVERFRRPF